MTKDKPTAMTELQNANHELTRKVHNLESSLSSQDRTIRS